MLNKETMDKDIEFNYNLYTINGNIFAIFGNLKKSIQRRIKKYKIVRKDYHLDPFMSLLASFSESNEKI